MGPVAAYFAGLHLAALAQRVVPRIGPPRGGDLDRYRPLDGLLRLHGDPVGIGATQAFKKSLGMKLVEPDARKQEIQFRNAVSPVTPVLAVEYLKKHPPKGQVYNSFEYGDYLNWAMPEVSVFVTSHVHLIPGEVWDHYLEIANAAGEWQQRLDWYRRELRDPLGEPPSRLVRALRKETGTWEESPSKRRITRSSLNAAVRCRARFSFGFSVVQSSVFQIDPSRAWRRALVRRRPVVVFLAVRLCRRSPGVGARP